MLRWRAIVTQAALRCALAPLVLALGAWSGHATTGAAQTERRAPTYQVDPAWPKPLPDRWLVGAIAGVAVDARDHVWIVHRPGTLQPNETRSIWRAAPPVLEFDQAGNLVAAWGGPGDGYEWPDGPTSSTVSTSTIRTTCGSAAAAKRTRRS